MALLAGCQQESSAAEAVGRTLPALTGRVVDNADLLPAEVEARLTADLEALENRTSDQLVIVTVADLEGEPIEQFARRLGNGWGIGREDMDNGVLIVVAPAERKVRIEVGEGLEGLLTDQRAGEILRHKMLPHFRANEHVEAIQAGVEEVVRVLDSSPARPVPLVDEAA